MYVVIFYFIYYTLLAFIVLKDFLKYSQLHITQNRINQTSPKTEIDTNHLTFIFYSFLPHISKIFFYLNLLFLSEMTGLDRVECRHVPVY